jgi:large subunit ribosomal protein L21
VKRGEYPIGGDSNKGVRKRIMYAVIASGGKQYKVSEGDTLRVEKLDVADGGKVRFDVLMLSDNEGAVTAGTPLVAGASVTGTVVHAAAKGEKILVFKYKPKKNVRRRQGHRQKYTEIAIEKIEREER